MTMMTVYDLIKKLVEYPPDMPVFASDNRDSFGEPSRLEVEEFYFDEYGSFRCTYGFHQDDGDKPFNGLILRTTEVMNKS